MNDLRVIDTATKDFLDANIVCAEASNALGHRVNSSLCNQTSQEVFQAELLRSNCGFDHAGKFSTISQVLRLECWNRVHELHGLFGSLLVADKNLRWMQAHSNQVLGLSHQLSCHTDEQISAITAFILLHL